MGRRGDRRGFVRGAALLGAVLLLACGALGLYAGQITPQQSLEAARARWAARPFAEYRMRITVTRPGGTACLQDIEVRGVEVTTVHRNTCFEPPVTIDTLFTRIEQINRTYEASCADRGGQICHAVRVQAVYHSRYGYPEQQTARFPLSLTWPYELYLRSVMARSPIPGELVGLRAGGVLLVRYQEMESFTIHGLTPLM
jgi:hypothetical protein